MGRTVFVRRTRGLNAPRSKSISQRAVRCAITSCVSWNPFSTHSADGAPCDASRHVAHCDVGTGQRIIGEVVGVANGRRRRVGLGSRAKPAGGCSHGRRLGAVFDQGHVCAAPALNGEENHVTALVRLTPGTNFPPHQHDQGEQCVVLYGELAIGERSLPPGEYRYWKPGEPQPAQSTEDGCLLLVSSPLDSVTPSAKGRCLAESHRPLDRYSFWAPAFGSHCVWHAGLGATAFWEPLRSGSHCVLGATAFWEPLRSGSHCATNI